MEAFEAFVNNLSGFIWGGTWGKLENGDPNLILPMGPIAVFLLGCGLYFMIRLGARPLRRLGPAMGEVWAGRKGNGDPNAITPWQALSTALSGQVGTGNLAGVATAITLGGPGAIFWMWVTAFFGMALAFAESSLAIKYREKDEYGRINGGPMYYIKNGLGRKWVWLGVLFCIGTLASAMATGGMVQSNSITQTAQRSSAGIALPCQISVPLGKEIRIVSAEVVLPADADSLELSGTSSCEIQSGEVDGQFAVLTTTEEGDKEVTVASAYDPGADTDLQFGLKAWFFGAVIAALTFAVVIGGIKSIGSVAGKVVPFMAALYVGVAFIVLLMNAPQIPAALGLIIKSAFGLQEAAGGAAGYLVVAAMRAGIARGLFSNEAGQGSAPIAHAAAQTKNPIVQGEIAMIGVFIDTLVICTMTALVILTTTGTWTTEAGEVTTHIWEAAGLEASGITNEAYARAFPGGGVFVSVCLALFAFTTIIGWTYYAEQAATYLVGEWATHPIRVIWVGVIFVGAILKVEFVWLFGDLANASMAFPNLIAILALSGVVMAMHRKNGDPDTDNGDSVMLGSDGEPYKEPAPAE